MLSQETVSHDAEDADPRLIAFARRPFKWRVEETIEIPVGLVAAHLNAEHGVHSFMELLRLLGFEGRFHGFMSWFTLPAPHRHIHVDILFGHRPLARKVMTYNEAERILRLDPKGIMPRLLIKRERNKEFRLEYRYRPDFEDVFACLLENGPTYVVPDGEWRFVTAFAQRLPFGVCNFFQLAGSSYRNDVLQGATNVVCQMDHNCQLRLNDVRVSRQPVPSNRMDDQRWEYLLDVSIDFRAILRRIRADEELSDNESDPDDSE